MLTVPYTEAVPPYDHVLETFTIHPAHNQLILARQTILSSPFHVLLWSADKQLDLEERVNGILTGAGGHAFIDRFSGVITLMTVCRKDTEISVSYFSHPS